MLSVLASAVLAGPGFVETFESEPLGTGQWQLREGDSSRFAYQPADQTLLARYNTLQPTTRLMRSLCRPLTQSDSFEYEVEFRIRSAGFSAETNRHAQIAFGLMNTGTTGTDRVYGQNGQGAYDLVSFDYFPNISLFGGPSAGTTIITTRPPSGSGYASTIRFEYGPETELNDDGEAPLPLDEWLTAHVRYDGPARQATLRILNGGVPLPIGSFGGIGDPGGLDGDPTTITTRFLKPRLFTVDSFGVFLWLDPSSPNVASVKADVDFRRIAVTWSAGGDFDHNAEIDHADLDHWRNCETGPSIPQLTADCSDADLDCDGDVDQADFGLLQAGMTRLQ